MRGHLLDDAARSEILEICREAASPRDMIAASMHDSHVDGNTDKKNRVSLLLVLDSPRSTLKYHTKRIEDTTISLLMVDQKSFEKDVERDWLGGLLV